MNSIFQTDCGMLKMGLKGRKIGIESRNTKTEIDLESQLKIEKGGGGETADLDRTKHNVIQFDPNENMSVCIDNGSVLATPVGTSASSGQHVEEAAPQTTLSSVSATGSADKAEISVAAAKNVAKLVVSNQTSNSPNTATVLQKVVNPPLITVLNSPGPLTVVKTLCVTSSVSSAPQFTLVNSTPLNVTNAVGKSQTITLLNAPVTVVKAISSNQNVVEKSEALPITSNVSTNIENRGHNVFVKNTCPDSTVPDMPQSHKLLTANNFPANVVTNQQKTVNGQRNNRVRVLSNVVVPSSSQTVNNNVRTNTTTQRYVPRQKLIGANGATAKYLNKPNNVLKNNVATPPIKHLEKSPQRMVYPTHKSQIKTIPPINNYIKPQGIKTLSPQQKSVPGQVQRNNAGLRTIPPQRPPKLPTKPNYIGKHAVQAQKVRATQKLKNVKVPSTPTFHGGYHNTQPIATFNQALTAEIIETLTNKNSGIPNSYPSQSKHYEILPTKYENAYSSYPENTKTPNIESVHQQQVDDQTSGLSALSLICQAVLLDHNYNATLPPDSPTRSIPPTLPQSQVNGMSGNSMYSPPGGMGKRRSGGNSSNNLSSTSTLSNISIAPNNSSVLVNIPDDDAASDVSDMSDRKHDTEGEETDTAPEAEAVGKEDPFEHYGDYVTRCLCGFLHDDGYMVECDGCKVWQHVQCVLKNKQVPDEYLCEVCDPTKPIDRQKARLIQQNWLRERQLMQESKLKKDAKLKETLKRETISDTDSSDGEHAHNNNIVVTKRTLPSNRRKSESKTSARNKRDAAMTSKDVHVQRRQKRRERKIIKRKVKATKTSSGAGPHSDDENHQQDSWSGHLPHLRQWIEKYEEAVTNHYSPELRARISNIRVNGAHTDMNTQFDCTVQKCRVHTQPLTELKYLVSTTHLQPNTAVVELRGKYMLSTQHRNSGGSLTTRQHSQRPGPFLFFYRLHKDNTEVCVDTRTYGNSARFIRRSCRPNAELRHCIEKGVLHLYIVSITTVEKNEELTIKHESHDLAAIGTTHIACACGNLQECHVNRSTTPSTVKKNGEVVPAACQSDVHRKRRGRRTTSTCMQNEHPIDQKSLKETSNSNNTVQTNTAIEITLKEEPLIKTEIKEESLDIKEDPPEVVPKEEIKEDEEIKKDLKHEILPEEVKQEHSEEDEKKPIEKCKEEPVTHTTIVTRRSSHKSEEKDEYQEDSEKVSPVKDKTKCKKLSREERKLEAILRAIEQMEKADQRKQEHQAKAQHRRESEPGPSPKEDDKCEPKMKRRRRKGRARTTSTNAHSVRSRNRLNSTDSYMTSGDETMLSPNDNASTHCGSDVLNKTSEQSSNEKAVGLLLALSNGGGVDKSNKSPPRDVDSNSNSTHSSPETQLSSACLLVQAAVEPLESGFKFPKTKKGLMNEWLNKVPESTVTQSVISPSSLHPSSSNSEYDGANCLYAPTKNLTALAQTATYCDTASAHPRGSAKKRWLRQAISEDHHSCDSPQSRPESPPLSEMVAPPKKRRLPRESLSNEVSPPTTPTLTVPPNIINKLDSDRTGQEGGVEIVYGSSAEGDNSQQTLECDAVLKERADKMKQEYSKCIMQQSNQDSSSSASSVVGMSRPEITPMSCLMDPRLARDTATHHVFTNSDHLVGTVEKTLSILGFEDRRPEVITPAKRKLSITEYRQRKKLNNNEKNEEVEPEPTSTEENNSSESFKATRQRSGSTSSSTSITSSDDETNSTLDVLVPGKVLSAFNSEPTELERQREISSMRLKKAFGLSLDEERPKPAMDVETLLSCELPTPVKAVIPLPSPTFPIPGSSEVTRDVPSPKPSPATPTGEQQSSTMSPTPEIKQDDVNVDNQKDAINLIVKQELPRKLDSAGNMKSNMFYTPDDDEEEEVKEAFETESVNYVPPFNNPVYPSDNYTSYTSTIDDDARYEGRNPSPPPNLETSCNIASKSPKLL